MIHPQQLLVVDGPALEEELIWVQDTNMAVLHIPHLKHSVLRLCRLRRHVRQRFTEPSRVRRLIQFPLHGQTDVILLASLVRLNHPVLRSEMNPASTGRDLQHVEIPGSDVLYGSRQPPVLDGAHCPTPLRADIPARATIVMPVPPAAGASAWTLRGRVPMVVAPKTHSVCQSLP